MKGLKVRLRCLVSEVIIIKKKAAMSDSDRGEPEDRLDKMQEEEEERNQIWTIFMQFD